MGPFPDKELIRGVLKISTSVKISLPVSFQNIMILRYT